MGRHFPKFNGSRTKPHIPVHSLLLRLYAARSAPRCIRQVGRVLYAGHTGQWGRLHCCCARSDPKWWIGGVGPDERCCDRQHVEFACEEVGDDLCAHTSCSNPASRPAFLSGSRLYNLHSPSSDSDMLVVVALPTEKVSPCPALTARGLGGIIDRYTLLKGHEMLCTGLATCSTRQ